MMSQDDGAVDRTNYPDYGDDEGMIQYNAIWYDMIYNNTKLCRCFDLLYCFCTT